MQYDRSHMEGRSQMGPGSSWPEVGRRGQHTLGRDLLLGAVAAGAAVGRNCPLAAPAAVGLFPENLGGIFFNLQNIAAAAGTLVHRVHTAQR